MGDKTKSGTPLETRGATAQAGGTFRDLFTGPGGQPATFEDFMGRLQSATLGGQAGVGGLLGDIGVSSNILGGAVQRGLTDPANRTAGLFGALQPFEARRRAEALRGVNSAFGSAGARFSGNLLNARAGTEERLFQADELVRAQALLEAQNQQNAFAQGLLGLGNQRAAIGNQSLGQILDFIQPGAPIIQQGLGSQLLGLAGTAAGAFLGGPGGAALGASLFGGGGAAGGAAGGTATNAAFPRFSLATSNESILPITGPLNFPNRGFTTASLGTPHVIGDPITGGGRFGQRLF